MMEKYIVLVKLYYITSKNEMNIGNKQKIRATN